MTAIINITPMGGLLDGGSGTRAQLLVPVGNSKNLSLTSTTARTPIPTVATTGDTIVAYRIVALSGPCYIKGGAESITAAAGDIAIPQNGEFYLPAKASITHIAGIDV
jgi:hypothetical protein